VGEKREGCIGDDVQNLAVDQEWVANPSGDTAPCCRNTTVVFASLYLTSLNAATPSSPSMPPPSSPPQDGGGDGGGGDGGGGEGGGDGGGGDGGGEYSFDELAHYYEEFSRGQTVDVVRSFLLRNLHLDGHFMQVVVSRGQRVLGMNFGGEFADSGCRDPDYMKNSLEQGPDYSAELTLGSCYADELVVPILRFWSYRYDDAGDTTFINLSIVFYLILSMDLLHTLFTMYSYTPSQAAESALSWSGVRVALGGRLMTKRFVFLELASWVVPFVVDAMETKMPRGMPEWIVLISANQLLMFVRAFEESEAFETIAKLVSAVARSFYTILGLCVLIVVTCACLTSVYGQLFGVFHFEDGGLGPFGDLWLEVFNVLIAGAPIDPEIYTYNPIGLMLMYLLMNFFLFLILSQVFIAILIGAFDSAEDADEVKERSNSIPSFYVDVGAPPPNMFLSSFVHFPTYLLSWYHIEYAAWGPTLLYALDLIVVGAEKADEEMTKKQVMVTPEELHDALVHAGLKPAAANRCVTKVVASFGAKLDVKARDAALAGAEPKPAPVRRRKVHTPHQTSAKPEVAPPSSAPLQTSLSSEAYEDTLNKLTQAQLDMQQSQHEDISSLQASMAQLTQQVEQNQAQLLNNQAQLIDALNQLASSRRERPQRLRAAQSSSQLLAPPQVSAFVVEDDLHL